LGVAFKPKKTLGKIGNRQGRIHSDRNPWQGRVDTEWEVRLGRLIDVHDDINYEGELREVMLSAPMIPGGGITIQASGKTRV